MTGEAAKSISLGETRGDPPNRCEREHDVRVDIEPREARDSRVAKVEGGRLGGLRGFDHADSVAVASRNVCCPIGAAVAHDHDLELARSGSLRVAASRHRPRTSSSLCAGITTEIDTHVLIAGIKGGRTTSEGSTSRRTGTRSETQMPPMGGQGPWGGRATRPACLFAAAHQPPRLWRSLPRL